MLFVMANKEKNGIERPPEFIREGERKGRIADKRQRELNSRQRKAKLQEGLGENGLLEAHDDLGTREEGTNNEAETTDKKKTEKPEDLIGMLESSEPYKRANAAKKLGEMGEISALPYLNKLLKDPFKPAQGNAKGAIRKIISSVPNVEKTRSSVLRTGPTKEAGGRERTKSDNEKLEEHIKKIVQNYNFNEYFKTEYPGLSEEVTGEVKKLIFEELEGITKDIVAYLIDEYGEESVKKSILENKLPEVELFEEKLQDIAVYFLEHIGELELKGAEKGKEKDPLDKPEYTREVLEGAAEAFERVDIEKEALHLEFEKAVDAKIAGILQKISDIRNKLKRSGINLELLDKEIEDIKIKRRAKIIEHCMIAFSPEDNAKAGESSREKIAFWANYFTEGAFKHWGSDDLRKAYVRVFPRQFGKIEKGRPAKVISKPPEPPKEAEEKMTMDEILVSKELKKMHETLEESILDVIKKDREAEDQLAVLGEDEKELLKVFLQDQYKEKFISGGSPDSEKARKIFTETTIQSIESKLGKK